MNEWIYFCQRKAELTYNENVAGKSDYADQAIDEAQAVNETLAKSVEIERLRRIVRDSGVEELSAPAFVSKRVRHLLVHVDFHSREEQVRIDRKIIKASEGANSRCRHTAHF